MKTVTIYGLEFEVEFELIKEEPDNNINEGVDILNVEHKGESFWEMFEALGFEELEKELMR